MLLLQYGGWADVYTDDPFSYLLHHIESYQAKPPLNVYSCVFLLLFSLFLSFSLFTNSRGKQRHDLENLLRSAWRQTKTSTKWKASGSNLAQALTYHNFQWVWVCVCVIVANSEAGNNVVNHFETISWIKNMRLTYRQVVNSMPVALWWGVSVHRIDRSDIIKAARFCTANKLNSRETKTIPCC